MKTKGQQSLVAKLEPLAVCSCGDGSSVVERGFCKPLVESSNPSHRPTFKAPITAGTVIEAEIRTAEAARIRKFSIRLLAVELKRRLHSDLPQLPNRMPEIR